MGRNASGCRPVPRCAAAVVLLLAAVLSGCTVEVGGVAGPVAPLRAHASDLFQDAAGRFGLVPPSGWTVRAGAAQGPAVTFFEPEPTAGPFRSNINVLVGPSAGDLLTAVAGAHRELRKLDGYRATTDEPATLAGGTPAHLFGGTFRDTGSGLALRNLQMFTVDGDRTVVVTGTSSEAAWDRVGPMVESSLRTLVVAR